METIVSEPQIKFHWEPVGDIEMNLFFNCPQLPIHQAHGFFGSVKANGKAGYIADYRGGGERSHPSLDSAVNEMQQRATEKILALLNGPPEEENILEEQEAEIKEFLRSRNPDNAD